jgi:hypothetical protein
MEPERPIEIGAAMALYGRIFILLVADGTKLPSNLQGLRSAVRGEVAGRRSDNETAEGVQDFKG